MIAPTLWRGLRLTFPREVKEVARGVSASDVVVVIRRRSHAGGTRIGHSPNELLCSQGRGKEFDMSFGGGSWTLRVPPLQGMDA